MGGSREPDYQMSTASGYPPDQWIPCENPPYEYSHQAPHVEVRPVEPLATFQPPRNKRGFWPSALMGYKRGLIAYTAATAVVLLFNIVWLIWARATHGLDGDVGTISQGTCAASQKLDSNLHAVVNFLSTIVLAASTTFMHIAYSPSRAEVDKAHAQHRCLSVGSIGFRNLSHISWRKIIVYVGLMLSSSPFHLLSNSAVFTTLAANGYTWAVVNEGFVRDTNNTQPIISPLLKLSQEQMKNFTEIQSSIPSYVNLTNQDCVGAYSDVYQRKHRTVLIVTSDELSQGNNQSSSEIFQFDTSFAGRNANNWICGKKQSDPDIYDATLNSFDKCDPRAKDIFSVIGIDNWLDWEIFNRTVLYCLSEEFEPRCSVQYSPTITALLIVCNALKLTGMVLILIHLAKGRHPLVCPGDAAASFLEEEDLTTCGMCMATRKGVKSLWERPRAKPYTGRLRRSWRGATRHRWMFFGASVLMILFGLFTIMLEAISLAKKSSHKYHFFSNFGKVNTDMFGMGDKGSKKADILSITAAANLPQFILAVMWMLYMDIYSSMAYARDWSRFEYQPQTLMVTDPGGQQRSVWIMGLPWFQATFLTLMQALMHYLLSQSIFPVRIQAYDEHGVVDPEHLVSNIGYSPIAMFVTMIICTVLFVLLLWVGRWPMPATIPIAGICSAAISAACHPTLRSDGMAYDYLRWGEVQTYEGMQRHCSMTTAVDFDAGRAWPAQVNVLYAGKG